MERGNKQGSFDRLRSTVILTSPSTRIKCCTIHYESSKLYQFGFYKLTVEIKIKIKQKNQWIQIPTAEEILSYDVESSDDVKGPNKEGRSFLGDSDCFQTPFGCCPDEKTEAKGPDSLGCPCDAMQYGCCPDGINFARGENYQGCGCMFSKFGCCSDGFTEATGPDEEGCSCDLGLFGCCPDGKTEASGPHFKGCCEISEFGCCTDNSTAATGPNKEDAGAIRPNSGAVLTVLPRQLVLTRRDADATRPSSDVVRISRPLPEELITTDVPVIRCRSDAAPTNKRRLKERISWDAIAARRYTDAAPTVRHLLRDSRKKVAEVASRPNSVVVRIEQRPLKGSTTRDAKRVRNRRLVAVPTVIPSLKDPKTPVAAVEKACTAVVPMVKHLPKGTIMKDAKKRARNLSLVAVPMEPPTLRDPKMPDADAEKAFTAVVLMVKHLPKDTNMRDAKKHACQLPKATGQCTTYTVAWYYDVPNGQCGQFYYGGCLGNNNRFATQEECERTCGHTQDPCQLPKLEGPCNNNYISWYFDKDEVMCKEFRYGGCKGNRNNFPTERDCIQQCASKNEKEACLLPKEVGPCSGQFTRWFYNIVESQCKPFNYDVCSLPKVEGPCKELSVKWRYDSNKDRCLQFYYGGCDGNANRFETELECQHVCSAVEVADVCALPSDHGPCSSAAEKRWYFNQNSGRCDQFIYGGCGGNGNNYVSLAECEHRCGVKITTADEFKLEDCHLDKAYGRCDDSTIRWYYKKDTGVCEQFHYSGCNGNNNRFETRPECEEKCFHSQEICELPKVAGPCSGQFSQWYFNPQADQCEEFQFGGCLGNGNRFNTFEDCQARCKKTVESSSEQTGVSADPCTLPRDVGPCQSSVHRWYFDGQERACKALFLAVVAETPIDLCPKKAAKEHAGNSKDMVGQTFVHCPMNTALVWASFPNGTTIQRTTNARLLYTAGAVETGTGLKARRNASKCASPENFSMEMEMKSV
uniref:BPTI/Kunitz inhibitor domain-containing protein n=1 Tax=Strigamia maritima TaxID=126957 RepID=T1JGC3_STRMM